VSENSSGFKGETISRCPAEVVDDLVLIGQCHVIVTLGVQGRRPADHQGRSTRPRFQLKLSVGSGVEDMVPNPVRPIRLVRFENSTD
jgi:hypothetical protein